MLPLAAFHCNSYGSIIIMNIYEATHGREYKIHRVKVMKFIEANEELVCENYSYIRSQD